MKTHQLGNTDFFITRISPSLNALNPAVTGAIVGARNAKQVESEYSGRSFEFPVVNARTNLVISIACYGARDSTSNEGTSGNPYVTEQNPTDAQWPRNGRVTILEYEKVKIT
jgi:hypothetical protein